MGTPVDHELFRFDSAAEALALAVDRREPNTECGGGAGDLRARAVRADSAPGLRLEPVRRHGFDEQLRLAICPSMNRERDSPQRHGRAPGPYGRRLDRAGSSGMKPPHLRLVHPTVSVLRNSRRFKWTIVGARDLPFPRPLSSNARVGGIGGPSTAQGFLGTTADSSWRLGGRRVCASSPVRRERSSNSFAPSSKDEEEVTRRCRAGVHAGPQLCGDGVSVHVSARRTRWWLRAPSIGTLRASARIAARSASAPGEAIAEPGSPSRNVTSLG